MTRTRIWLNVFWQFLAIGIISMSSACASHPRSASREPVREPSSSADQESTSGATSSSDTSRAAANNADPEHPDIGKEWADAIRNRLRHNDAR